MRHGFHPYPGFNPSPREQEPMTHRAEESQPPPPVQCGSTEIHPPHGICPGLEPPHPDQARQQRVYELADFHPGTSHLHNCATTTDSRHPCSLNCIHHLYAAAEAEAYGQHTDGLRIHLAREALIQTGYFTAEQVSDDIAPRITELWSALTREVPPPLMITSSDPDIRVLNPEILDGRGVLICPPGTQRITFDVARTTD